MDLESTVAQHYARESLEHAILAALAAMGKDVEHLAPEDLAPVDEFHIGGRAATRDLADAMRLAPGMALLDIGCGLGGAARFFAGERGCRVTGLDLTEDYVRCAAALAQRVGLGGETEFRQGSALDLPFAEASFDAATLLHVGMNIADKARLFAEARRVLRPGGVFGLYDVMREGEGDLAFPVPWAAGAATSFVEGADTYRRLLEAAGFAVEAVRSRRAFAIAFFQRMRAAAAAAGGPSPLGLHLLMGETAPLKARAMLGNLEAGLIAPTEIIARAV
ncbi:MAG: class I SAM-dependent methyltransferase [Paracraurococcus sp.]